MFSAPTTVAPKPAETTSIVRRSRDVVRDRRHAAGTLELPEVQAS
jgi:hypothetical protein